VTQFTDAHNVKGEEESMRLAYRDGLQKGNVTAEKLATRALHVEGHRHSRNGLGTLIGGLVVAIVAIVAIAAVIATGSDTEAAIVPPPATPTQSESAAAVESPDSTLTAAQIAEAARWTAQAESFTTGTTLTAAQTAEAARWTALAESFTTGTTLTAAQTADAARWTALAESFEG